MATVASPLFCPPNCPHIFPARSRASSIAAIPAAAADHGKKPSPSPSHPSLVRRVLTPSDQPKRPWWAPLLPSASRRPGSDRAPAEWVAASPATKRSDDGEEIAAGEGAGGRKRSALTAEKARVLRKQMRATETWRDAMYHSAIASRLASPDEH